MWSSWDGEWSVDGNGDGTPDVATVSEDGYAYLLDGATGAVVLKSDKSSQAGLRVATVQTEAGPRIAMGTYPAEPIGPSMVLVIDAVTGESVGEWPVHSMVLDLAPADLGRGSGEELLVGAGWQVHALDLSSLARRSALVEGFPRPPFLLYRKSTSG